MRVFGALLVVAIALLAWAFSTRGKEGMLIFALGAGILVCTLVVSGLRLGGSTVSKRKAHSTNLSAILGALIGLFLGGFVGARIGFGRLMISIFNPDLPEQDFGASFGAIGGGLLGAFLFAVLGGVLQLLIQRPEKAVPVHESDDQLPKSRGDTA